MVAVASWGRLHRDEHQIVALNDRTEVMSRIRADAPGLAFGKGRSYGDACLNPGGILWQTAGLDRFIEFDSNIGRLVCEAGVVLGDIQRLFIPRGWCVAVSPGTQFVTVGGAIANDVHGKNHHASGSFGHHVRKLILARTDGTRIECAPDEQPGWFAATVGGIGLTGIILQAELQLKRVSGPWLATETIVFADLNEFFSLTDESDATFEYVVSWMDCRSGRGLFMRGNHTETMSADDAPRKTFDVPIAPPVSLVNRVTARSFNSLYYTLNRWRAGRQITHYESYFYPLDKLSDWNRLYGPRGFYQYQCVVPDASSKAAIAELLAAIADSGLAAFLPVVKRFGRHTAMGMLTFPMPGVTLAVDFPNNGADSEKLFGRLDAIVRAAGGRIYLAKDARMPREVFEAGYERRAEFQKYRDPGISSAMSRRLLGD